MQANLFSNAIEHKERALTQLDAFEFDQAWSSLEVAREIDPYLADLDILAASCSFARYAGAHAKMPATKVAELWHLINEAYGAGSLAAAAALQLRQVLARRLLAGRFTETLFAGAAEKNLHRGVCHLVLAHWQEAHRDLLDLATAHPELARPVHWGYLGDAAYALKRWKDANLAYLRLLFTEAQEADLLSLQHVSLRQILNRLSLENDDEVSTKGLWPFYAWRDNVIEIPAGNTFLFALAKRSRSMLGGKLMLERKDALQQFMLCLYIDQSQLQKEIAFDVRAEMQGLEPELFAEYLAEVERRRRAAPR